MRRTQLLVGLLLLTACGGSEEPEDDDGGPTDRLDSGGMDACVPPGDCAGRIDGTSCGTGVICVGEACVASECGDGLVDLSSGEECDDMNMVAFDGCES